MKNPTGGFWGGVGDRGLHVIDTCHGQNVPSQPHSLAATQGLQGNSNDQKGTEHLAAGLQEQGPPPKGVSCPEGNIGRQLHANSIG